MFNRYCKLNITKLIYREIRPTERIVRDSPHCSTQIRKATSYQLSVSALKSHPLAHIPANTQ